MQIAAVPLPMTFVSPLNLRRHLGRLDDLSASIIERGVLQPLIGRSGPDGQCEIVAGARRRAAAALAVDAGRLPPDFCLPVQIRDDLDDEQAALASAIENLQRLDLTPIEEAEVYENFRRSLPAHLKGDKAEQIATKLNRSVRTVYNRLKLLRLADPLREGLERGILTLQQAEAFAEGAQAKQTVAFEQMRRARRSWSAREIRSRLEVARQARPEVALVVHFGALGLTPGSFANLTREELRRYGRLFADLENGLPPGASVVEVFSEAEVVAAWKRSQD